MVTLEQAKQYLRVDFNEDDDFITQLIYMAEIYIDSLVGEDYKNDTQALMLSELLQLMIISSMYDNRTLEANNISINKIAHSILDKLSNCAMKVR